jgi:hypothetical protein
VSMSSVGRLAVLLVLLFVCSCSQSGGQSRSYRAAVYTDSFATRFGLPENGVHALDVGLHAVALRVVERAHEPPSCSIDLYLDDNLDLAYPAGSEGVQHYDDDEDPLFFVRKTSGMGRVTFRWDAELGNFHSVACRMQPRRRNCIFEQGGPAAFSRHLVPGVALVTYELMCSVFEPTRGPSEIWLVREGRDSNALDLVGADETGTYRFAIPQELLEHAADRIRRAIHVYDKLIPEGPTRGEFSSPRRR